MFDLNLMRVLGVVCEFLHRKYGDGCAIMMWEDSYDEGVVYGKDHR